MNKMLPVLTFIFGGIVCSAITGYVVHKIDMEQKEEEIASVKSVYSAHAKEVGKKAPNETAEKPGNDIPEKPVKKPNFEKPDLMSYAAKVQKYTNYRNKQSLQEDISEEDDNADTILYIGPDEMGDEGYEKETLIYFQDGYLTDEYLHVIDDGKEILGPDFELHFGDHGDDACYVRNDFTKTDYEVLYDERDFEEVKLTMPPEVELE